MICFSKPFRSRYYQSDHCCTIWCINCGPHIGWFLGNRGKEPSKPTYVVLSKKKKTYLFCPASQTWSKNFHILHSPTPSIWVRERLQVLDLVLAKLLYKWKTSKTLIYIYIYIYIEQYKIMSISWLKFYYLNIIVYKLSCYFKF